MVDETSCEQKEVNEDRVCGNTDSFFHARFTTSITKRGLAQLDRALELYLEDMDSNSIPTL